jgi:hypothetical protein
MKKDILNETFNKHTFLLKKKLYEQGVIQQQPIQEVELEEGLKDIALATLLGLSTLFNMTGKADTSTTGQPTVSASSELSRVKSAKQKAEGVATEIAQRLNGGDDISKSTAKRILDDVIKFNKTNKFGSKAQMDYAVELAASNDPNLYSGINIKPRNTSELISQTALKDYISVNDSEILEKINTTVQEIAQSSKDALVKKANITDSDVLGLVSGFCMDSAKGDFLQMVAQKLVDNATRP